MPRQRGSRTQTGYRIPPDIERRMDKLIDDGVFPTRAEFINTASRHYLDHLDQDIPSEIRKFLETEEGKELILNIVKESRRRKKAPE